MYFAVIPRWNTGYLCFFQCIKGIAVKKSIDVKNTFAVGISGDGYIRTFGGWHEVKGDIIDKLFPGNQGKLAVSHGVGNTGCTYIKHFKIIVISGWIGVGIPVAEHIVPVSVCLDTADFSLAGKSIFAVKINTAVFPVITDIKRYLFLQRIRHTLPLREQCFYIIGIVVKGFGTNVKVKGDIAFQRDFQQMIFQFDLFEFRCQFIHIPLFFCWSKSYRLRHCTCNRNET